MPAIMFICLYTINEPVRFATYQQVHQYDRHKEQEQTDEDKGSIGKRVEWPFSRRAVLANGGNECVIKF